MMTSKAPDESGDPEQPSDTVADVVNRDDLASLIDSLIQPRHADLRNLIMSAIHRGEEAREVGRAVYSDLASMHADFKADIAEMMRKFQRVEDLSFDILSVLRRSEADRQIPSKFSLKTEHSTAQNSADHIFPRGTANDDTRHPRFVRACERIIGRRPIRHLDLGCAGGGLVWDFLSTGHLSYGIEGSDYSLLSRRAYWRVIPENLFTADITKPYSFINDNNQLQTFDVITAWEVLEHIPEAEVDGMLENISRNLTPGGFFVASVASFPDQDPESGAIWHVTLKSRDWWIRRALNYGLRDTEESIFEIYDFPRGSGNPRVPDWNAKANPELGFHLVLRSD